MPPGLPAAYGPDFLVAPLSPALDLPDLLPVHVVKPHTVRGALAGALKKKLGLTITSEKVDAGERRYRISDMPEEAGC